MTKKDQIIEYAQELLLKLEEEGIILSEEKQTNWLKLYIDSEAPLEDIKSQLLRDVTTLKDEHERKKALSSEAFETLEFYQLPGMYHGLTLNEQDIDLLNIVGSSTPEELTRVAKTLTNIPTNLTNVTNENLEDTKRELFKEYQRVLIPKNVYYSNPSIGTKTKMDTLLSSGFLSEQEISIIKQTQKSSATNHEMIMELQRKLGPKRVSEILSILREIVPIEKSGVKNTTYEAYENLYKHLYRFNSLTLDDQFKYGSIVLEDGTIVFDHFEKGLQFAKEHNMQVRCNSLISYMNCPEHIYNAPKSEEMRRTAFLELDRYIKAMFSLLARDEYKNTVRSIDIFNELLNRKGNEYTYRGDAPEDVPKESFDDYNAGWLKHLSIDDICELIARNKYLLENQKIDFLYNEVFLEKPQKMQAFHQIMEAIKRFESNHFQIIDTLGIQLHTDSKITREQLQTLFEEMARYGYPIEITEFDMTLNEEDIKDLSEDQIEIYRQRKINEILTTVYSLKDECRIKGFTIWSLTDTHNFEVSLANQFRIPEGKEPIETLHGGYFTEEMTPRSDRVANIFRKGEENVISEEGPKLKYNPPKPNLNNEGFVSTLVIAIVLGGFLGILLAFAVLNIK